MSFIDYFNNISLGVLVNKTLIRVENDNDEQIIFTVDNGDKYCLYHSQDCCERVTVEDICGDLNDLIGTPILMAEENSNNDIENLPTVEAESFTWTFYRISTIKGQVVIRWLGTSNGYYSESVNFCKLS